MDKRLQWRKSSYSGNQGECVEVRGCEELLVWNKSSFSGNQGACVEAAGLPNAVLVRDTQNRSHGHLGFPSAEWASFLQDVKSDRL